MSMSKKDYEGLAAAIRETEIDYPAKRGIAEKIADFCAEGNELFSKRMFVEAALGLPPLDVSESEKHSCDLCDGMFDLDDMDTLGGDRETDAGLVAYPAVCIKCAER